LIADLFTLIGITPMEMRAPSATNVFAPRNRNSAAARDNQKLEKEIIKETSDEMARCRNFTRIFPSGSSQSYKGFFEGPRPFNELVDSRMGRLYRREFKSGRAFVDSY